MSFEIENLDLRDVVDQCAAEAFLLDPKYHEDVTVGYEYEDPDLAFRIPQTESLLACRLGVDTDADGSYYGVNPSSTALKALVKTYEKACTTAPKIIIGKFNLEKEDEVSVEWTVPLRAYSLQQNAAALATRYTVETSDRRNYPKGKLWLVGRAKYKPGQIRPNPFYVKPEAKDYVSGSVLNTKPSWDAIYRGTTGTS